MAGEWVERYIRSGRPVLLGQGEDPARLFLSKSGRPLTGNSIRETWDKKGLARAKTRRAVEEYCSRRGKKAPLIGEPEDMAKWLSIEM